LNLPIKESELPEFLKPYLELIQTMGHMSGTSDQVTGKKHQGYTEGKVSEFIDPLHLWHRRCLQEFPRRMRKFVNAEFVAQRPGIG